MANEPESTAVETTLPKWLCRSCGREIMVPSYCKECWEHRPDTASPASSRAMALAKEIAKSITVTQLDWIKVDLQYGESSDGGAKALNIVAAIIERHFATEDSSNAQGSASSVASGLLKASEIEALSDRELDAEIARLVMEFVRHRQGVLLPNDNRLHLWFDHAMKAEADRGELYLRVPPYSTDTASAFLVVEKLRSDSWDVQISSDDESPTWQVYFDQGASRVALPAEHNSLPRAICLAALQVTVARNQA